SRESSLFTGSAHFCHVARRKSLKTLGLSVWAYTRVNGRFLTKTADQNSDFVGSQITEPRARPRASYPLVNRKLLIRLLKFSVQFGELPSFGELCVQRVNGQPRGNNRGVVFFLRFLRYFFDR